MPDIQDAITLIKKAKTVRKKGAKGKKAAYAYKDICIAFDIETTRIDGDNAIMYIWQADFEGVTITGRDWESWLEVCEKINGTLGNFERVIIWVHNLSYEMSFLKGIGQFDDVFMVKPRKFLYAVSGGIEYRCSYFLSNMSLEKFLEQMDVENKKLSFDYNKKRYPWTALCDDEMAYCINDVKGLTQAIRKRLENDGDTLATIPYTATGYIRRDAKKAYNKLSYSYRQSIIPSYGAYRLLRYAFRGGDTHANRWVVGQGIIDDTVYSYDRASSYPDVMCTCKFPIGSFYHVGKCTIGKLDEILARDKAVIMRVTMTGVRLKDVHYPMPYIARHKCLKIIKPIVDNGRILYADYIELCITDIDLKIMRYQYDFDMNIIDLYYSRKGYLWDSITELIKRDYAAKTALKGTGNDYMYARSKERVNAWYGLTAQDPVRDNLIFVGGDEVFTYEGIDAPELLERYRKKAFLPYQIGVWVTAYARYRLFQGVKAVYENSGTVCYCDTDSVKFYGMNDDIQAAFDAFNEKAIKEATAHGIVATDSKGIVHPSGVYELDGIYKRFSTLGAKKYVYEDDRGLHITIAGVNKKLGAKELGRIENFKEGFIFRDAGGLEAVYNDAVDFITEIDGHKVRVTDNVCLRPSTYTIGLTQDYKELLIALSNDIYFVDFL